jgi:hypothetical protein
MQVEAISGNRSIEETAQNFTRLFFDEFRDSVVLVRVFATVPYEELPLDNKRSVDSLASSAGISKSVDDTTNVLSLIGTRGRDPKWNNRRNSAGHVGIPLASSEFINSIPMMSRLLKQLGVNLDWIQQTDTTMVSNKNLCPFSGTFYVRDARTEVDQQGRKVIAAQDFVDNSGVRTVFGFGGAYLGARGTSVVIISFCSEILEESQVQSLQMLVNAFKIASNSAAVTGSVFSWP